jgi:acyl-coenzyme A synthetase/AMP-(fatty) acid ligase
VTHVNIVPSVLALVLEHGGLPPTVETITFCGEPLKRGLVQQCFEQARVKRVVNFYGPTEDTVFSTFAEMRRDETGVPSIGRPLPNTQVYLLERGLNPVPVGAPGELYLGGIHLARGYLNRPALTAERFVPDPFSAEGGGRLYRTGDLARYGEGGQIEFMGRCDTQVKVRGFRIELGEIEAVLEQHPAVREAVVRASRDGLTAYVLQSSGLEPAAINELREFAQSQLPHYMVPSAFIKMERWPLTQNGKIDRKALPDAQPARATQSQAAEAPQTEVEREVARAWRDVLRVERVGTSDNFYELGGHRLLLLRLQHELRRRFGREVTLAELSAATTVGEQARLFGEGAGAAAAAVGEAIERARRQKEVLALQRQRMRGRVNNL